MSDKTIAIITARGGSKRIPHKNIKSFLGHPIIKYSIDASLSTPCIDKVMVSTDDKEIAEISKSFGAEVPFFRSEKTASDQAIQAEVVEEVLVKYREIDEEFKYFCCIMPTAPFITSVRLEASFKLLVDSGADAVIPVVRFSYPIQRAFKIEKGELKMLWPENRHVNSQDLLPTYHDAGQFYWLRVESFLKQKKIFAENIVPIIIPESEVQDIDTEEDWKITEAKYKIWKNF